MKNIRGGNAIVTGASRGLGTYIAQALAAEGVNLALAARSADKLEATRSAVAAAGVKAIAVPCDVTSRADLMRLIDMAEQDLGPVDILVNNAGIEVVAPLDELSLDQIEAVIQTNLTSQIWLAKLMLRRMLERRRGAIVNVASMAGKVGNPYNTIYSASKAGLVGFTDGLVAELDGTGVSASVVCPTFVSEAGMWAEHGGKAPRMAREVTPGKVAQGVLKAIRNESPQVLVTSGPIKPLLALAELAPGMKKTLLKRMGITKIWQDEARKLQAGDDRRGASGSAPAAERETADIGGS